MSILKVKNVSKIYTTRFGSTKVQALSNMNFTVEQGGVCGDYGGIRLGQDDAVKHSRVA